MIYKKKDSTNAITQISTMQRLRLRRTNRNEMNGKPLNHLHFTAYVSNTCKDENSWRPDPVSLHAQRKCMGIFDKRWKMPLSEKLRELMNLKTKTSTNLLFELWAACGRAEIFLKHG